MHFVFDLQNKISKTTYVSIEKIKNNVCKQIILVIRM